MKPEKLYTIHNKYSDTVVYTYRGHTYDVEYAKSYNYCVTDAKTQHQNAQARIDEMIEQERKGIKSEGADEALDEWFKFMEG